MFTCLNGKECLTQICPRTNRIYAEDSELLHNQSCVCMQYLSCRVGCWSRTQGWPVHWRGRIWSRSPGCHPSLRPSLSPAETGEQDMGGGTGGMIITWNNQWKINTQILTQFLGLEKIRSVKGQKNLNYFCSWSHKANHPRLNISTTNELAVKYSHNQHMNSWVWSKNWFKRKNSDLWPLTKSN